jgi:hypothetical protein
MESSLLRLKMVARTHLGLLAEATAGFIVMDTASRKSGDGERPGHQVYIRVNAFE